MGRTFLRNTEKKIQTGRTKNEAEREAMRLISFDWRFKACLVLRLPAKRVSGPRNNP